MKFEQLTIDLKSSIEQKGKVVTKIYTFMGGVKKTVRGVKTDTVIQGQFTKYETLDGRLVFINDNNVLSIEVFNEDGRSLS
jgi:hypothetical protein